MKEMLRKLCNGARDQWEAELVSLSAKWDPQYEVTKKHGTTFWIRHQRTLKEIKVYREKLRLVDPNACWDEIAPRPRRQQRRAPNAPLPQVAHQLPQQDLNINMQLLPDIGQAQGPHTDPPDAPIPRGPSPDVIARPPTPPLGEAPERARTPEPMECTVPARPGTNGNRPHRP